MPEVAQRFNVRIPTDNGYGKHPEMMFRVTDHLSQHLGDSAELESKDGKLAQSLTGDYTLITRSPFAAIEAPFILKQHYGFQVEKSPSLTT